MDNTQIEKLSEETERIKQEIEILKVQKELKEVKRSLFQFKKGIMPFTFNVFYNGGKHLINSVKDYFLWVANNQTNKTKRRLRYKMGNTDSQGYLHIDPPVDPTEKEEKEEDDSSIFEGYSLGVPHTPFTNF